MTSIDDRAFVKQYRKAHDRLSTRSSFSTGQGGECVEVTDGVSGLVPVRDSKVSGDVPGVLLTARARGPFVTVLRRGTLTA
ncbi:DUF397 domain-containing protein [Streptomyces sp. H62]